jgi:hypothetical protein
MKRILPFILLLGLYSCSKQNEKFVGIWKMQEVNINGSSLYFEEIGMPYLEFNKKGGYMLKMSGVIEKGCYKVKDDKLTLKPKTADKPSQDLTIDSLGKDMIKYHSQSDINRMDVTLYRVSHLETELSTKKEEEKK